MMDSLKFLVDENVERSVVLFLREKGYNVLYIAEDHLSLEDLFILRMAVEKDRVIITSDKDFGYLIFKLKEPSCGIILLRLKDQSAAAKLAVLPSLLDNYRTRLYGSFVVVSDWKIRIRKL